MIRRPPRSTLFPSRRSSDLLLARRREQAVGKRASGVAVVDGHRARLLRRVNSRHGLRSEEHTSELQSHVNLVCRLLLEKKKKKSHTDITHTQTNHLL